MSWKCGRLRTGLDENVARQFLDIVDGLILKSFRHFQLALGSISLILKNEDGTIFLKAATVETSADGAVDGFLKHTFIPTTDKVTMIAKTGRITIGEDKLSVNLVEQVRLVNGFVEQDWKSNRIVIRTPTIFDLIRIRNVCAVIGTVQVLTIPTRWKHQLGTDAISTGGVKERLVPQVVII